MTTHRIGAAGKETYEPHTATGGDWLPELHDDDIGVLLDALKAWETQDAAGEVMGDVMADLMADLMARKDPAARARFDHERATEKMDRDHKRRQREERSVLLRAKLITLRDRRLVKDYVDQGLAQR